MNFPRGLVWKAWATPRDLAQWWGPSGFTNTMTEFDLRVGGAWRMVMHGPNGVDFPNHAQFVEIDAPRRVVFKHLEAMHAFTMTITLGDAGPKTKITWRMQFESPNEFAAVKDFIPPANEQNFDRLESYLAQMPSQP